MCGRFAICISPSELARLFALTSVGDFAPRYNVAPSQKVAVVRAENAKTLAETNGPLADGILAGTAKPLGRRLDYLMWGLVGRGAKDAQPTNLHINVRSETAGKKPTFKEAFAERRCLLPASGFYEWKKEGRSKQPYYFKRPDGRAVALAGLWERWENAAGAAVESCAILTTAANETVREVHDRMPVMVEPRDFSVWLDAGTEAERLGDLLRPYPAGSLTAYAVNPMVNRPQNDGPGCIEPWTRPEENMLF